MINHVKERRTLCGLTQEELAGKTGVSRQTINSIEAGRYQPSTLLALKLARALDLPVEDLFVLEADD